MCLVSTFTFHVNTTLPSSLSVYKLLLLASPTFINKSTHFSPSIFKPIYSLLFSFPSFDCFPSHIYIYIYIYMYISAMAAVGRLGVMIMMILAVVSNSVSADPDLLQDVCVADLTSGLKVNGFVCKTNISSEDFFSNALANPGLTNNTMGSLVTAANVQRIPGLNTLGVSLSRVDYAPGGLNPPHTHPRATEIAFVLEGELEVGFITTANVLISKTIKKGEIFVFPRGLVHFQKNNGKVPAAAIAGFNSQLPGTQSIAATLFAATPPVPDNVLTKAFQVDTQEVEKIKSRLAPKK